MIPKRRKLILVIRNKNLFNDGNPDQKWFGFFYYLCEMPTKVKISKNDIKNGVKSIRRNNMLELGVYNIHKNRVFKSKKKYTRKPKHKDNLR